MSIGNLIEADLCYKRVENLIKIHRLFYSKIPFLYGSILNKSKKKKKIKTKKRCRETEIWTHVLLICSLRVPDCTKQVDSA